MSPTIRKTLFYIDKSANQVQSLNLSPNPVSVNSSLNIEVKNADKTEVKLFNINGLLIKESVLEKGHNTLDTNGLTPGIYILESTLNGEVSSKKLLVN